MYVLCIIIFTRYVGETFENLCEIAVCNQNNNSSGSHNIYSCNHFKINNNINVDVLVDAIMSYIMF